LVIPLLPAALLFLHRGNLNAPRIQLQLGYIYRVYRQACSQPASRCKLKLVSQSRNCHDLELHAARWAFCGLLLQQYMQLLAPRHLALHQPCDRSAVSVSRTCISPSSRNKMPDKSPRAFLILYFVETAASLDAAMSLHL